MGITPAYWGPCVWASIHLICLGAPEQFSGNQLNYRKFFESLPYVLPCDACKQHLTEHLEKHPMDAALAGGRDSLFTWSVQLHNAVNRSLGKPEMTVEQARHHWDSVARGEKAKVPDVVAPPTQTRKYGLKEWILMLMVLIIGITVGILLTQQRSSRRLR
jgi:hypothetical protein